MTSSSGCLGRILWPLRRSTLPSMSTSMAVIRAAHTRVSGNVADRGRVARVAGALCDDPVPRALPALRQPDGPVACVREEHRRGAGERSKEGRNADGRLRGEDEREASAAAPGRRARCPSGFTSIVTSFITRDKLGAWPVPRRIQLDAAPPRRQRSALRETRPTATPVLNTSGFAPFVRSIRSRRICGSVVSSSALHSRRSPRRRVRPTAPCRDWRRGRTSRSCPRSPRP